MEIALETVWAMTMSVLAMVSRFFITIAMNTGIQYTVSRYDVLFDIP